MANLGPNRYIKPRVPVPIGTTSGFLTVVGTGIFDGKQMTYPCRCNACGEETFAQSNALLNKRRVSCGCQRGTRWERRLFNFVRINVDTRCWEWTGTLDQNGYGRLGVRRDGWPRNPTAHRLSYDLYRGEIPSGIFVLHRCDNPPCCNPSHLFLGTQADNIHDMLSKGRHWSQREICQ